MMILCTGRLLQCFTVGVILGLSAYTADAVSCYQCTSPKEVCNTGQCQGEFCFKIMATSNPADVTLWTWGCATSTALSKLTAGCKKTTVSDWTQNSCYCQDKEYCNASPPTNRIATEYIVLLSTAALALSVFRLV